MPHDAQAPWMDSARFRAMCEAVLSTGASLRFHARGMSMQPNILDGDLVVVAPAKFSELRIGEVVLSDSTAGFRLHRIVSIDSSQLLITTQGDASIEPDLPVQYVLGKVVEVERYGNRLSFSGKISQLQQTTNRFLRRLRLASSLRLRRLGLIRPAA